MIREIAATDRAFIERLALTHEAAFERGWSVEEIASLTSNGLLLADDAAAFALFSLAADEAELLTIAAPTDRRREGRGRALLRAAYPLLAARGAATLHLDVAETNEAARALYASEGFDEVGRRRKYYGAVDALLFSRPL